MLLQAKAPLGDEPAGGIDPQRADGHLADLAAQAPQLQPVGLALRQARGLQAVGETFADLRPYDLRQGELRPGQGRHLRPLLC